MKSLAWHLLGLAAAVIVAAGCQSEQAADGNGNGAAEQDASADTASRVDDATASAEPADIAWFDGGMEAAFARALADDKPVFLYWGAVWCPYCRDLEEHVLSRQDFREQLTLFVPVYLDGDDPGAQRWGEELGVVGYPTVLVLAPDRTELARIAGGMDMSVYADVLDLVLGEVSPLEDLLASLDAGTEALPAADCRRLAYTGWGLDESADADQHRIAAALAVAAQRCPEQTRLERARLTVIAAAYAAAAEADAIEAGAAGGARLEDLTDGVREILSDLELAVSVADALRYLGAEFFLAADRREPARTAELRGQWVSAMDAVADDTRYTEGSRLAALDRKLAVLEVLSPDGEIPDELAADAKQRIEEALVRVGTGPARTGLVNAALNLLVTLGDFERAYELAEQEKSVSRTPYYYMSSLAALDERMGRPESAVAWLERAYRESQGTATRFQWGTNYVRGLIRLTPRDEAAVREATIAVLGELEGPDRLYRRSRTRLDNLEAALIDWNADGSHDAAISAIRDRMMEICDGIRDDETAAAERCRAFLAIVDE